MGINMHVMQPAKGGKRTRTFLQRRNTMKSSLPISSILLAFAWLLFFCPLCSSRKAQIPEHPVLTHHGGPVINGTINLALLWYGDFGRIQKNTIRNFVKSLNNYAGPGLEPKVSSWWQVVESYQSATGKLPGPISPRVLVRVAKSTTDNQWEFGKVITIDYVPQLVQKATGGDPNVVAVIFTSRAVTVQGFCRDTCQEHGTVGGQPFIMVGNPETECPGTCAWPFHSADSGPQGVTYKPPSGDIGADALVIQFATALADLVTNPKLDGFFQATSAEDSVEAATACLGKFGSKAFPGYTGNIRVDPATGAAFNTHGNRNKKFLLPGIWNPKTSSCWTPV